MRETGMNRSLSAQAKVCRNSQGMKGPRTMLIFFTPFVYVSRIARALLSIYSWEWGKSDLLKVFIGRILTLWGYPTSKIIYTEQCCRYICLLEPQSLQQEKKFKAKLKHFPLILHYRLPLPKYFPFTTVFFFQFLSKSSLRAQSTIPPITAKLSPAKKASHTQLFLTFASSLFVAEYLIPIGTPSPDGSCKFTYRSISRRQGRFNSPRHPSNYPSSTNCTYLFFAKANQQVQIVFSSFKIRTDNLKINKSLGSWSSYG